MPMPIVDFHWFTDCHLEAIFNMNVSREFSFNLRLPSTGKMFVWSPAFLLEPGSTLYSSAPSITTVWSNYQTSYNDFFEVYITETVTLSPNFQMVILTSLLQTMSRDQLNFVILIHKYVIFRHQLMDPSKSIMDDHWQWLSFNAKLACNK